MCGVYSVVSNQNHVRNDPNPTKNTVYPTNRTRPVHRMRRLRLDARIPVWTLLAACARADTTHHYSAGCSALPRNAIDVRTDTAPARPATDPI